MIDRSDAAVSSYAWATLRSSGILPLARSAAVIARLPWSSPRIMLPEALSTVRTTSPTFVGSAASSSGAAAALADGSSLDPGAADPVPGSALASTLDAGLGLIGAPTATAPPSPPSDLS